MSEILGVMFAALIGIMIIPTFGHYTQISNDNARAVATAQQQQLLITAATEYIQQNATAIQSHATASAPAVITVPMLQATGLLPNSFGETNPYGQTWQVQVLQPVTGQLQALVMATGGAAIADKQASKIASIVGAAGGFVPLNDSALYAPDKAYGSYGGWSLSTAGYSPTAGTPAAMVSYTNSAAESNYLYRNAVPGQPQLNRMNTALDMGANDINNAGAVNAASVTATGNISAGNGRVVARDQSGVGGSIQLVGANGQSVHVENINGTLRLMNSARTASTLSVDQSGNLNTNSVQVPAGNNIRVGSSSYYGDGSNSAVRQSGTFYVQHYDGSRANISSGDINSGTVNVANETWGLILRNGSSGNNSAAQNAVGSANLNDIYLRSINKWMSQLNNQAALKVSTYGTCTPGTYNIGNHIYCATGNSAGNAYAYTIPVSYVGTNSFGSQVYNWQFGSFSNNCPTMTCFDQ